MTLRCVLWEARSLTKRCTSLRERRCTCTQTCTFKRNDKHNKCSGPIGPKQRSAGAFSLPHPGGQCEPNRAKVPDDAKAEGVQRILPWVRPVLALAPLPCSPASMLHVP